MKDAEVCTVEGGWTCAVEGVLAGSGVGRKPQKRGKLEPNQWGRGNAARHVRAPQPSLPLAHWGQEIHGADRMGRGSKFLFSLRTSWARLTQLLG